MKLKFKINHTMILAILAILFLSNAQTQAQAQVQAQSHKGSYAPVPNAQCGGFPQAAVESFAGSCLAIVLDSTSELKMPRYAVQAKDSTIYISEMGGWAYETGSIWALQITQSENGQKQVKKTNLFPNKKLTMPNGLLIDPEGRLYVGLPTGLYRFHPKNSLGEFVIQPELELVEDGFRSSIYRKNEYENKQTFNEMSRQLKHKHPLIQMAANHDFTQIYINVGAPSDRCQFGHVTKNKEGFCSQAESSLVNAGIWQINLSADSKRNKISTEAMARGLRNSMGLAVHPQTQKLFQAENSMDLPDQNFPYEEINVIQKGKHYGWPYCHSNELVNELFKNVVSREDCLNKYSQPALNMPAHTAPLSLLFYSGKLFPELNNHLLVSWHGYRDYGQKVVSYEVNPQGEFLTTQAKFLIDHWTLKKSVRPMGAPTGLTELNDGSILVIDDKNSTVLLLTKGNTYTNETASSETEPSFVATAEQIEAIKPMMPFLKSTCSACHSEFGTEQPAELIQKLISKGILKPQTPLQSPLFLKIQKREMPLGNPLNDHDYKTIVEKMKHFLERFL